MRRVVITGIGIYSCIGKDIDEITSMGPELMAEILGEDLALSRPKCSTLGITTLKLAIRELERQELKKLA